MGKRKRKKNQGTRTPKVTYPIKKRSIYTYGPDSPLDLRRRKEITTADAVIWYYSERYCNWDTGITHKLTVLKIAKGTGLSVRSVYRSIANLKRAELLEILTPKSTEYVQFRLWPFGEEARKMRLTNVAPIDDKKDPFALLLAGKIYRETFLLWLRVNIGWQKTLGVTMPMSLATLAEKTGISARKIFDCLKQLKELLLVTRVSKPKRTSIFHLWPFPKPKAATEAEITVGTAEISEPDPTVVFVDAKGITHYQGERYKQEPEGWRRWMSAIDRWVFVGHRVPEEILEYNQQNRHRLDAVLRGNLRPQGA